MRHWMPWNSLTEQGPLLSIALRKTESADHPQPAKREELMTKLLYGKTAFAALALFGLALQAAPATAQDYPNKPIRLVLGFGAGGGTDIVTRIIAQPLSEKLGQPVVVENKPGAGGTIAANLVAKSPKDGYTASMMSTGHTVSAAMYKSLPFDSVKDFAPVAKVGDTAFLFVANKDFKPNNIKELIAAAKANPGKIKVGSVGLGSTQHFAAELLRQLADIDVKHVPYKNTPTLIAAVRSGEVDYIVDPLHTLIGQVKAGDIKPLAVSTPKRWPTTPDIPTVAESGVPGYNVIGWYGVSFPVGTPKAVVDKFYSALKDVLSQDAVKAQVAKTGALVSLSASPDEFGKHLADEVAKWNAVRTKAGIPQR
jgi:tripartite-type tricarboxylate transporter receptor subunit TctC